MESGLALAFCSAFTSAASYLPTRKAAVAIGFGGSFPFFGIGGFPFGGFNFLITLHGCGTKALPDHFLEAGGAAAGAFLG